MIHIKLLEEAPSIPKGVIKRELPDTLVKKILLTNIIVSIPEIYKKKKKKEMKYKIAENRINFQI